MTAFDATGVLRAALRRSGRTLERLPGRNVTSGLLEVKELGPCLRASIIDEGIPAGRVALNYPAKMVHWNRPTSQVDLVVLDVGGQIELVAELKVWDIAHQLFDLAKVCCLLAAGARSAFLVCVAQRGLDFDRQPGGELFPAVDGETRTHDFVELIGRHRSHWRHGVGKGMPEPTTVPTVVATTAVVTDFAIDAYPGHAGRAVEVTVLDATPVPLSNGLPLTVGEPSSGARP